MSETEMPLNKMTELEHKRLIAKNTVALYVRMLVRLAVTLYTSRIVLDVLGVDDFALYGIVGGIVTLFTFLQTALNASTQRFMSVELGRGDLPRLKRVFDVSMSLYLLVALIVVVVAETLGLWFLNTQLIIPPERMNAVNWVFQFTILITCVNIIQTPYNASIIAHEKMSFYAWISIADVVLKLGAVFLLMVSPVDKLASYAGLLLVVWGPCQNFGLPRERGLREARSAILANHRPIASFFSGAGWARRIKTTMKINGLTGMKKPLTAPCVSPGRILY